MVRKYNPKNYKICIIGLGYVGLPLLLQFSKYFDVFGVDKSVDRINALKNGIDPSAEISNSALKLLDKNTLKYNLNDIPNCDVYLCTLPTPISDDKKPDLAALIDFCNTVGLKITKNNTIVFESAVYPGVTEDVCIPILERKSG